jgi:hypothetical protein
MRQHQALLLAGLFFGLVFGSVMGATRGLTAGLAAGAVSGVLFGVAMGVFASVQRARLESRDAHFEGEPVLHQGPANHWAEIEARGGWLVLTASRLAFRAHGFNVGNAPLNLALTDVAQAEPTRSLGVIPNSLRVVLRDGRAERFVVNGQAAWVSAITRARTAT